MPCSTPFPLYHTFLFIGHIKRKRAFEHAPNAHFDHPAHAQSNIQDFALHSVVSNDSVNSQ